MAVTYKGEIARRTARNRGGIRTYTRVFRLITTDRTDTAYDVGSHTSLPVLGAAFPDDSNAWCVAIDVRNTEPWKIWQVTAEYSTERQIGSGANEQSNPENDEVLISFSSEIYQQATFQDVQGAPLINTAGDLFLDPPPTKDIAQLIIRIRANVLAIPTYVLDYQAAVNSAPFQVSGLNVGAKLAKMQRIEIGNRERRGNYLFYPITIDIHVKKDGWKYEPLSAGFREAPSVFDDKPVEIRNTADGELVSQPVPLDANGNKIEDPTLANAHYMDYELYPALPFNVFPGIT